MKKSKIKQELEILNSAISSLAERVKEIESSTKSVNEPLSELPEKWCVGKLYPLESIAIVKWLNNEKGVFLNNMDDLSNMYLHYPYLETFYPFFHKLEGYTQISFSDFERLVLKKGELEVGKWYKYELANALACYSGSFNDYGFVYNKWCLKGIQISDIPNWKPATKEEVESALIEEAKRRGYKPNENLFYYDVLFNILYDRYGVGRQIIFNNGKWAAIVEEPKQEIDWSVPGQLVESEDTIVLTQKSTNVNCFSGTVILLRNKNTSRYLLGECYDLFRKDKFIIFKGEITLSNESI